MRSFDMRQESVIWSQQHRKEYSKEDILAWARSNDWQKLEVLKSTDTVEFKAYDGVESNSP
jgi:hypothetical protein